MLLIMLPATASAGLFGYREAERSNLSLFPQWLSMLERNIRDRVPEGHCETRSLDSCHVRRWQNFINSIRKLPRAEQIRRVNRFANQQEYILDIENYGVEDYWATPKQFLYNNGDCEDYAITKMLSLKQLGFDTRRMRIVVLQDTNLRIAHAVLAVDVKGDTLIMDNQIEEVVSHRHIVHYVPIYSVNEQRWWMYLPAD
jgi:predicted transglutaminase-like cysteine proteinase